MNVPPWFVDCSIFGGIYTASFHLPSTSNKLFIEPGWLNRSLNRKALTITFYVTDLDNTKHIWQNTRHMKESNSPLQAVSLYSSHCSKQAWNSNHFQDRHRYILRHCQFQGDHTIPDLSLVSLYWLIQSWTSSCPGAYRIEGSAPGRKVTRSSL